MWAWGGPGGGARRNLGRPTSAATTEESSQERSCLERRSPAKPRPKFRSRLQGLALEGPLGEWVSILLCGWQVGVVPPAEHDYPPPMMASSSESAVLGTVPVIRRQAWLWIGTGALFVLLAIAWFVLREFQVVPRRGHWRHVTILLALAPFYLVYPLWQWRARRLREALFASRFRLCTRCAYDLSTLSPTGTCPECGHDYDAVRDVARWEQTGAPYAEPRPEGFVPWSPAEEPQPPKL